MKGYTKQALEELKNIFTAKRHYAPSKLQQPNYGTKIQFIKEDTAPLLSEIQIKHIEKVVRKFLYYNHVINNTMLRVLNDIVLSKSKGI